MECAVGTDYAAYVRTKTASVSWSNWSSPGGKWQSSIVLNTNPQGCRNYEFGTLAMGQGAKNYWINWYAWDGTRTGWRPWTGP
ncbi:hypothetical protein [Streptomyces sp. NPDC002164]|uniref:hypothetical protein n=1 Tax=Streptomyces sp. NPDC002164 TaxID=3364633 RepID=UPI0036820004